MDTNSSIGLFVATSIYLARDIAATRRRLIDEQRRAQQSELERGLLQADVARKTKELEDARALQLSMLPDRLPDNFQFAVAADMQTATEVGGDYYDFRIDPDATFTLAIGDATGHGLKAGMLVAITKSLFLSGPSIDDIPAFFARSTRILKQMQLGNLFMAMAVMRFESGTVTLSAAGLPPLLVYRRSSNEVEEFRITGMPLGAFEHFPYQEISIQLSQGDIVLANDRWIHGAHLTEWRNVRMGSREGGLYFGRPRTCIARC